MKEATEVLDHQRNSRFELEAGWGYRVILEKPDEHGVRNFSIYSGDGKLIKQGTGTVEGCVLQLGGGGYLSQGGYIETRKALGIRLSGSKNPDEILIVPIVKKIHIPEDSSP